MSKVEKSVQRQETKSQSVAPKYRELSDSELEIVCGGSVPSWSCGLKGL